MMTLLKPRDIRDMSPKERKSKLAELRQELFHERGVSAMGGAPPNPGRIKDLRTEIARILTIEKEGAK